MRFMNVNTLRCQIRRLWWSDADGGGGQLLKGIQTLRLVCHDKIYDLSKLNARYNPNLICWRKKSSHAIIHRNMAQHTTWCTSPHTHIISNTPPYAGIIPLLKVDRHVENLWWTSFKFLYYTLFILRIIFPKRKHTIFELSFEIESLR